MLKIIENIYDNNQDRELKSNHSLELIKYILGYLNKIEKYDFDQFLIQKLKSLIKRKLD